jgi:hypothetical protein
MVVLGLGGVLAAVVVGSQLAAPPTEATIVPAPSTDSTTSTTSAAPISVPLTPPDAAAPSQSPSPTARALAESRMMISPPPDSPGVAPGTMVTGLEGITIASALPLFKTDPPRLGLDAPLPGTKAPVNNVDLFTGKPITYSSPTKMYKGYTVAFCCTNSAGYNGGWDGLTEAEKDTYVRSFLK